MQLGFSSFITNSTGIQIKSSVEEISVEQKEQGTVSPNCSEEVMVTLQKESPGNKDIYSNVCVCLCLSESDRGLKQLSKSVTSFGRCSKGLHGQKRTRGTQMSCPGNQKWEVQILRYSTSGVCVYFSDSFLLLLSTF